MILDNKTLLADGRIVHRRIWLLPTPTDERPYGLKFSLYCGRDGITIVRYDNEKGKGAHKHVGESEVESRYDFVSLMQLLNDFMSDVENLSGEIK